MSDQIELRGKTFAQIRKERKEALRKVRRAQRALDTRVERMEREISRLLDRKTLLTVESADRLRIKYHNMGDPVNDLARALADFYIIVSS